MNEPRAVVPTVSAIIPTWNRAAYLPEAIESALRIGTQLKGQASFEIIVVDDGSTDDTAEVAARYPVRYIGTIGAGASAARNTGIRAATGEFVAFLDDDDVWLDGHIVQHLEILRSKPHVALVYAQGILADSELNPVYCPGPPAPLPNGDVFAYFLGQCLQWNTVVARKAVLEEVGCFDESLWGCEDWDLQIRLSTRYDCAGVPLPVTLYRQSDANTRDYSELRRWYAETIRIVRRDSRLPARSRVSLRQRLLLTFSIRGWYSYQFLRSAQASLRDGKKREARRCIIGAMSASPLHACLRLRGYWRTAFAALFG